MLSRTYPSECQLFQCDYLIVNSIRDLIGDKVLLKRYRIATGGDFSSYFPYDSYTFYTDEYRIWPYHAVVGTTVCSGIDELQAVNYHYMVFNDSWDVTASGVDLWVEAFKISDYEIWTSYLSVDLTSHVINPDCITDTMIMYQAAIQLLPMLRADLMHSLYSARELTDRDTNYKQQLLNGIDPFKDLENYLQTELNKLINKCNKTPINEGYRIE